LSKSSPEKKLTALELRNKIRLQNYWPKIKFNPSPHTLIL